ncbi:MAG: SgcJ/EcaC family oxidoreductase [Alphaproteobacteria bacterium]|nr:MAG: SgcJ/EcaC family oxidoreductase [Alphaproteobacteria bacterium]
MWRIVMIIGCLSLGAPALAQNKTTIEKLNDAWTAAFNKGDAAAVAALYTEDAYVLPPGSSMVKGRAAIEAFWRQAAQQMTDAKLTTVDVLPLGRSAAREVGTVTLKTKSQPPQEVVGKYVVVWRKIGRDWKLATDIWNTDK